MFDIEPFQRRCDQLVRCTHKRAVLDAVVSALTLLCDGMSISHARNLQSTSAESVDALAYRLILCVFAIVAWMLSKRRPPKRVCRCLDMLNQALFDWIWRPAARWCRTSFQVQQIFGAITMARSAIWLRMHWRSNLAKQIGRMMPAFVREVWWPDATTNKSDALNLFLNMQLAALLRPEAQTDSAWLYCWWQRGFRYVGMARARRADQCKSGGPLSRFVEHLSLRTRQHHRDSQKFRYRKARAYAGGSFWWLPTFVGPVNQVAAMEFLEIQVHKPNANARPTADQGSSRCKGGHRKRPPKWRRRCASARPKHAAWEAHVGSRQLEKRMAPSIAAEELDMSQWSFSQAYRHMQRCHVAATAIAGPLSIYMPVFKQLLMIWAAAGNALDWSLLETTWKVPCGPVAVARLCHLVKGPQRLKRVRKLVNDALALRGLPTTRLTTIPVPIPEMVGPARRRFAETLGHVMPCQMVEWCMSRIRFSHCKIRSHKDSWTHVRDAKNLDWEVFRCTPAGTMQDALRGRAMQRVEKAWDVPRFLKNSELNLKFQQCLGKAFALVAACRGCRPPKEDLSAYRRRRDACSAEYNAHTQGMQSTSTCSLIPDDKCKKFAWRMPRDVYHFLLAYFVMLAANWQMTTMCAVSANQLVFDVVMALIPKHLVSFLGLSRRTWILPYSYATIKAKCFKTAGRAGRSCFVEGHSCVRKIISWATWPKKSCWRMVSRGLQIALERGPENWQVWNLRDAPAIVRKRLANLHVPDSRFTCGRCGCAKAPWQATVHDAGQFFECVTVTDALRAARETLQMTAERTGCFYTCVFRRKKKAGFLSPHRFRFLPRRFRCFDFQELFLVFAAAISVTYVSVGDRIVKLSTLCIGGIMSMIASAMVLCVSEHKWLQNRAEWQAAGFSASLPWSRQVAALRYVDDLLQVSAMYCAKCLTEVPGLVYEVPFNLAESGTKVTWIDLCLDLDLESPAIGMAQKPVIIQPPWAAKQGYVRSWLCGRFARWQQVRLSKEQTVAEVMHAFWELLQNGYSLKMLRAVVFSFKHERWTAEFQVLRACYFAAKSC